MTSWGVFNGKSLAVYYYTRTRDEATTAPEHNTIYRQTSGIGGYLKTSISAAASAVERARDQGVQAVVKNIAKKVDRAIKGKPPENG